MVCYCQPCLHLHIKVLSQTWIAYTITILNPCYQFTSWSCHHWRFAEHCHDLCDFCDLASVSRHESVAPPQSEYLIPEYIPPSDALNALICLMHLMCPMFYNIICLARKTTSNHCCAIASRCLAWIMFCYGVMPFPRSSLIVQRIETYLTDIYPLDIALIDHMTHRTFWNCLGNIALPHSYSVSSPSRVPGVSTQHVYKQVSWVSPTIEPQRGVSWPSAN